MSRRANSLGPCSGFRGRIRGWDWSIDGSGQYQRTSAVNYIPNAFLTSLIGLPATLVVPPPLDVRGGFSLYNPLADHGRFPVQPGDVTRYSFENRQTFGKPVNSAVYAQVHGSPVSLPAGDVRLSLTGELVWSSLATNDLLVANTDWLTLIGQVNNTSFKVRPPIVESRSAAALGFETVVPVIGKKYSQPWLQGLELVASGRRESYNDGPGANVSTIGAKFSFTPALSLRYSRSDGFRPPEGRQVGGVQTVSLLSFITDPKRGNTFQPVTGTVTSGANPDLLIESSLSHNLGLIYQARALPGLTLTVDYFWIEKHESIETLTTTEVLANEDFLPGRVTRDPASPADIAAGFAGPVTAINMTALNVSFQHTEGLDYNLRYRRETAAWGTFSGGLNATQTLNWRQRLRPISPLINFVGVQSSFYARAPLEWRGRGFVTWEIGNHSVSVTSVYSHKYQSDTTAPTALLPNATGVDGDHIPSSLTWDLQYTYHLPLQASADKGAWKNLLAGTEWTIGARNVFDRDPPFRADQFGFYSRFADPRQRFGLPAGEEESLRAKAFQNTIDKNHSTLRTNRQP